jgi:hypothetical protein
MQKFMTPKASDITIVSAKSQKYRLVDVIPTPANVQISRILAVEQTKNKKGG